MKVKYAAKLTAQFSVFNNGFCREICLKWRISDKLSQRQKDIINARDDVKAFKTKKGDIK